MSPGSRPSVAHQRSRTPCLWAIVSTSPNPCQMSAWRATQAQRLLLAAAADEHRDLPGRRRVEPAARRASMRGRASAERRRGAAGRAELVAVLVVVLLEPAGADAEDEPAAADVVDGAGHVGEQVGVAVAVARDERADLDPVGLLGPRAEHRPALEVLAVGVAVQGVEVVPVEHDVDADLLGRGDHVAGCRSSRHAGAGSGFRCARAGSRPAGGSSSSHSCGCTLRGRRRSHPRSPSLNFPIPAQIAQSAEHFTRNEKVEGSIPSLGWLQKAAVDPLVHQDLLGAACARCSLRSHRGARAVPCT